MRAMALGGAGRQRSVVVAGGSSTDDLDLRPSRKMSAEAMSRKSSFVNSKLMHRSKQSERGSGEVDGRGDSPHFDEPSCSETQTEDTGGTRRGRSVGPSRMTLFFGKEKNEMISRLNSLRDARKDRHVGIGELEANWTDIVKKEGLSRRCAEQQAAIWEIVTTEYRYLQLLRNMDDLRFSFTELQKSGFLKDIDVDRVFVNYSEIYHWNLDALWRRSIIPMLEKAREDGSLLDPSYLKEAFDDITHWSQVYIKFNLEHDYCHTYTQKKQKEHELFREFVYWAESQECMRRQKLCDTLTLPMQRLTRYSLLLKAVLRTCSDEDERRAVQEMVERADAATQQLNFELNNNDLRLQMADLMTTIDGYDVVDSDEHYKLFGTLPRLDIEAPMPGLLAPPRFRRVFHKGDLKMNDSRGKQKTEQVHCFIFTDMFLICKMSGKKDKLRIIRPPIHIARVVYHSFPEPNNGFYLCDMNEFGRPNAMYLMYTSGFDETKRWLEILHFVQNEYTRLYTEANYGQGYDHMFALEEMRRRSYGIPPAIPIIHRKCSSVDSQSYAASAAPIYPPHLSYMQRNATTISSAEQLDRQMDGSGKAHTERMGLISKHKLSIASGPPTTLSTSKSSVDLRLAVEREEDKRERSNSTEVDASKDIRSRSHSREKKCMNNIKPSIELDDDGGEDTPKAIDINPTEAEDGSGTAQGRRFEKRYHTADGIDVTKPKGTNGVIGAGILKRFSWNVSSAVGGSSRKISAKLGEHSRRFSQASTNASNESFGSSTSGISSGSDNISNIHNSDTKTHISTVAVNELPESPSSIPTPSCTLNISLDTPTQSGPNESTTSENPAAVATSNTLAPPLPDGPPPQAASPVPRDQLMEYIMQNDLETS
ncbi:hypothetical protein WR25_24295 [Diploscapter pachys]|uniref:DH domain-containing protein n=1 Tax=Diploscapter pachys TaxID=2018661 RepID=A0A2A2J7I0_9BILA|nr:hypothetical protein WR25_24295 [Diploscapter pachys]